MRTTILGAVLAVGLFLAALPALASFDAVVVYGDSLSDNGNLYGVAGIPGAPYYQGRRSNGPVAVEYLASSLGVPLVDYAWVGATTGAGNFADGGTVTTAGKIGLPGMSTVYAATRTTLTPYLADGLFIVWGGPNDILVPSPEDTSSAEIITRAVTNDVSIVTGLLAQGAQHILVPGMPDLGLTPRFQASGPVAAGQATAFSDSFNALLQALLPESVIYVDTSALMRQVMADPEAYGFTNVTDACYNGQSVVGDPDTYFFFDSFHPSTAAHALLAREFESAAVPEPATLLLAGGGLGVLVLLRRKA